jgi:transposase-like protein
MDIGVMKALNTEKSRPRSEYWRELIRQQEQSGMKVKAFCVQQGVTEASFYNWRKQLRCEVPVRFALVDRRADGFASKGALEVMLASGERVQVGPGTDAATLRMVLAVLRERA